MEISRRKNGLSQVHNEAAPTIVIFRFSVNFHLDKLQALMKPVKCAFYVPDLSVATKDGRETSQSGRLGSVSHLSRAFVISNRFVRCDQYVDIPIVVMVRDKFVLWEKLLAEAYGDYFD